MTSALNIHLEHYEGPLDLLLDLIRKQQIDIRDIPIATITSQYLESLQRAREQDINIGAEFVFMAATLIYIKSKMLLPSDPALQEIEGAEEDPRTELVNRLLEHEKYKNAAEMLQQKRMIEENVWSNPQMREFSPENEEPGLAVELFDLVQAFGDVLERLKFRPVYEIQDETVSVSDMMQQVHALLAKSKADKPLFILQVLEKQRSRRAAICLFLAVLELVKMQAVVIVQKDLFGEIALRKSDRYDEVMDQNPAAAEVEQEYK